MKDQSPPPLPAKPRSTILASTASSPPDKIVDSPVINRPTVQRTGYQAAGRPPLQPHNGLRLSESCPCSPIGGRRSSSLPSEGDSVFRKTASSPTSVMTITVSGRLDEENNIFIPQRYVSHNVVSPEGRVIDNCPLSCASLLLNVSGVTMAMKQRVHTHCSVPISPLVQAGERARPSSYPCSTPLPRSIPSTPTCFDGDTSPCPEPSPDSDVPPPLPLRTRTPSATKGYQDSGAPRLPELLADDSDSEGAYVEPLTPKEWNRDDVFRVSNNSPDYLTLRGPSTTALAHNRSPPDKIVDSPVINRPTVLCTGYRAAGRPPLQPDNGLRLSESCPCSPIGGRRSSSLPSEGDSVFRKPASSPTSVMTITVSGRLDKENNIFIPQRYVSHSVVSPEGRVIDNCPLSCASLLLHISGVTMAMKQIVHTHCPVLIPPLVQAGERVRPSSYPCTTPLPRRITSTPTCFDGDTSSCPEPSPDSNVPPLLPPRPRTPSATKGYQDSRAPRLPELLADDSDSEGAYIEPLTPKEWNRDDVFRVSNNSPDYLTLRGPSTTALAHNRGVEFFVTGDTRPSVPERDHRRSSPISIAERRMSIPPVGGHRKRAVDSTKEQMDEMQKRNCQLLISINN